MLAAAGLAFTLSACGNATESGIEQLVESQGGGDVDLDLDGDGGFAVQTEDGGMTIDEDGNFVITDADGSVVTGNADAESGEFTVESEDGSFSSGSTTELPEEWPGNVPEPDGLQIASATVVGSNDEQSITVSGSVEGDGFVDSYASALEAAGFSEDSTFTSDGTINNVYSNDEWTVGLIYFGDQSDNQVNISVFTKN
jgi:flagellar basal body rod protein FlgG